MAAATQTLSAPPPAAPNSGKRKRQPKGNNNNNNNKKLVRSDQDDSVRRRRRNKPSAKFLKLLRKRARDYNSDDEEEDGDDQQRQEEEHRPNPRLRSDDDDEAMSHSETEEGEDEEDEVEGASSSAVTRFEQGCRAFRVAFLKIMSKELPDDDPLGPIMSAHKTLVAAKLAEEVQDHKPKGEARKEKRVAAEKGHVIPKDHLDSKEKELIKVATKGVVRLFNAVSKAQKPRKDLNPSRTKDAKAAKTQSFQCHI